MNKLWIFGDSYSTYNRERGTTPLSIYTNVSEYLNLEQSNMSISGLGNLDIYMNLLRFLPEYKKGDIIIFQLSFLDRFSYVDRKYNKKLNLHEMSLYSITDNFFLHPQYYHNGLKGDLTDRQLKSFNTFVENIELNLFDFYYKFFIQLKHIITFLEKLEIDFKILLLEDRNMDYNGGFITLISLLEETSLVNKILMLEGRNSIKSSKFCVEQDGYEYHHFSLDIINKIGEQIKKSFE